MMKPMIRRVGNAMKFARVIGQSAILPAVQVL